MSPVYVSRSSSVAARVFDGETIVMSPLDSTIFVLNPTATSIWQAADGHTPLDELVREKICSEFEVGFDTAMEDALELVRELSERGILEVSDKPPENEASR